MLLTELLAGIAKVNQDVEVTGLTLDSRTVKAGDAFIALKGDALDGRGFITAAIENGAAAVISEPFDKSDIASLPETFADQVIQVEDLKYYLGGIADRFYQQPSTQLKVVGITGTNGKTSSASYLAQILEFFEERTTVMGTLGVGHWQSLKGAMNTTPDVISVHQNISRAVERHDQNFVMEVSSHGLVQGRLDEVKFHGAIFTNLSRDHLDYHGTMEAYAEAKQLLFKCSFLQTAVINLDDAFAQSFIKSSRAKRTYTFSMSGNENADVYVSKISASVAGLSAKVHTWKGDVVLNVPLIGEFNLANVLGCFTYMLGQGISAKSVAEACCRLVPAPGRMQVFTKNDVSAIVDYAHTPDALKHALIAARKHCQGNLHVVFGCGGDRDTGKRPEMALIAEQFSDRVWVTDDNPRGESPAAIFADIKTGFKHPEQQEFIHDRFSAIEASLNSASPGDVVLIAGKGHENYQEINGERHYFDDAESLRKVMGL